MLPYITIFISLLVLSAIEVYNDKRIRGARYLFFIFCCYLVLFIGLRTNGYDYKSYLNIYTSVHEGIVKEFTDPGFVFICGIAPSYRTLLIIIALLTIYPLYKVIRHESPYVFLSLLLFSTTFLYPTVMGQMRQGVAIFIMLYAYFKWRNNYIIFITIWILCCTIHSSAFIAILLLIPLKKRYSILIYSLIIIMAIVVSASLKNYFSTFIDSIGIMNDSVMGDRLEYYNSTETEQGIEIGFNTAIIIRCFVFILAYYILNRRWEVDATILNLYLVSILFYLILGFMPQLAGRGSQYFVVFDLILIPWILKACRNDWRIVIVSVFLLLSVSRFIQFFSDEYNRDCYVPYKIKLN